MEAQRKEKAAIESMVTKSVPMHDHMIKEIHKLMADHLMEHNQGISFGEATRRVISAGLENIKKIGWYFCSVLV